MHSIILLDIDGTLIRDDLTISSLTAKALREAREGGYGIAISTGRYVAGARFYLEELGVEDGIISAINGALIKMGDIYLKSERITREAYARASHLLYGRAPSIIAFSENRYAIDSDDEFYGAQARICREKGVRMDIRSLEEVEERLGEPVYKILVKTRDRGLTSALLAETREAVGGISTLVQSYPTNFEVLPYGTDKRCAVITLSERLSIPRDRIIAFGDWDNDAGMLEEAGVGVAMGNASDALKRVADIITLDNNHDGIPYALKKLGVI